MSTPPTDLPEMEYRFLGRSGLQVSEISIGGWLTYGGHVEDGTFLFSVSNACNYFLLCCSMVRCRLRILAWPTCTVPTICNNGAIPSVFASRLPTLFHLGGYLHSMFVRSCDPLRARCFLAHLHWDQIGFGKYDITGLTLCTEKTFTCLKAAYDIGVNFFDCAEGYAGGESEKVMGRAIKHFGWKRNDIVVSTKVLQNFCNTNCCPVIIYGRSSHCIDKLGFSQLSSPRAAKQNQQHRSLPKAHYRRHRRSPRASPTHLRRHHLCPSPGPPHSHRGNRASLQSHYQHG